MPNPGNGSPRHEVHCSKAIAKEIRQLQRRASLAGKGAAMIQSLRELDRRLPLEPWDLGEALYNLPALRMQVRCVILPPLIVDYAVCEDRPLVFLKGVRLL